MAIKLNRISPSLYLEKEEEKRRNPPWGAQLWTKSVNAEKNISMLY